MTGSYFRGDAVPVLDAEDEAKFTKVTYNYYEQLNGYDAPEVARDRLPLLPGALHRRDPRGPRHRQEDDPPHPERPVGRVDQGQARRGRRDPRLRSATSIDQDPTTGVIHVKRRATARCIKVADLVNDDPAQRAKIVEYLRTMQDLDDIDLIIALGMAKEGFDWPYCEHALTVGYRGSLTEIIQIIGRCTRDSPNKTHAQFTNLIAQPDAGDEEVKVAVNNMLKAITASLLMEQVLAPNFKFKTKTSTGRRVRTRRAEDQRASRSRRPTG